MHWLDGGRGFIFQCEYLYLVLSLYTRRLNISEGELATPWSYSWFSFYCANIYFIHSFIVRFMFLINRTSFVF